MEMFETIGTKLIAVDRIGFRGARRSKSQTRNVLFQNIFVPLSDDHRETSKPHTGFFKLWNTSALTINVVSL